MPEGELQNFTLLLGIALTDAPAPNMGNFGYIPCSHTALARAIPDEAAALALGVAGAAGWKEALGVDLDSLAPPVALWHARCSFLIALTASACSVGLGLP